MKNLRQIVHELICCAVVMSIFTGLMPNLAFANNKTETVPTLPAYNSSTNFSTSTGDGTWDGGVWRAEYWHPDWWSYVPLTNVHQNGEYTDNMWDWSGEAIRVNGTDIMTTNSSNTKFGVRAFIAPYKGTVTIKSADVVNQSGNGIYVRIIKTNRNNENIETLWGNGVNNNWFGASFTPVYEWNTVKQDEIANIAVEEGDIIRFEAVSMDTGSSGTAHWTNEIIYTTTVEFVDANGNELTDFNSIASAENAKARIQLSDEIKKNGKATVIVAFYDSDRRCIKVCTEEITDFSKDIELSMGKAIEERGGSIKVFVWDSLSSMKPLCKSAGI